MGPLLVNTKQKVATLASGLVIATTGFVAPAVSTSPGDDSRADTPSGLVQGANGDSRRS